MSGNEYPAEYTTPSSSSSFQQKSQQQSSSSLHLHQQHHHHHHHQQAIERESVFPPLEYRLAQMGHCMEDIVICVDADAQIEADMKVAGANGRALSRLDAVKQAIFLFVHAKLAIQSLHKFAFAGMGEDFFWLQPNFTSNMDIINSSIRNLSSRGSFFRCDLSSLFHTAASLAKRSQAQGRILRVVLIYSRSSTIPTYPSKWPQTHKSFTFDALYLHDKPTNENCPQQVYDALVEALERVSVYEGYIYENGSHYTRILFRQMSCLLAHPQQRCSQDDFVPKDLSKKNTFSDSNSGPVTLDDSGNAPKVIP
ncbi:hypothetical protein KP509_14G022400 [Ceratopteris richardii]|uniref:BRISC and BRCA1-A complex member 1 n=1 Tax=Ceratopteris richardii TaxID=49495 RepID=A0A8T2T823_CERRI|nr:hypothetical protein KP509_14G022400 [Ceratopteris richardii]